MSDILIRTTRSPDIPVLAQLMGELGYPTTPQAMASRMAAIAPRSDFATFVAECDGAIAGMIGLSVTPTHYKSDLHGTISALVVSSAFRGRGIAQKLVAHGEAWLQEHGAHRAAIHPSTHREDAHRLYTGLGYTATGTRFTKDFETL